MGLPPVPARRGEGRRISLINAWVTPTEALVAVDTDGLTGEGVHRPMSKIMSIAHLPAVIASRGSASFLGAVHHLASNCASFDELVDGLPGLLRLADSMTATFRQADALPGIELVAVGWSKARGRMICVLCTKHSEEEDFACTFTEGVLAPMDRETMGDIPRTPEALPELARAQVQYLRERIGLGGGTLIVASVTREGINIKHTAMEEVPCLH